MKQNKFQCALIKMLHKKLISIVLPTYNGSRFLRDSIESVVSQTYEHWELIIVNDCSTDNTLKIAKEYEERDSRIRVISNNINKKLPASLNIGFVTLKVIIIHGLLMIIFLKKMLSNT